MFYQPQIDHLSLPCPRLPPAFAGLTLLHLSDMHITQWSRHLTAWQKTLAALTPKPHILLITGDLGHRSWLWKTSLHNIQKLLEPLTPPLGTFFILGNHDSAKLGPALAQTKDPAGHPRTLLQNQTIFLVRDGSHFAIDRGSGISDTSDISNTSGTRNPPPSSPRPPNITTTTNITNTTAPRPRLALIGIHQHRRIDTDIPSAMTSVRSSDFKLMLLHYPDLIHPAIAAGADICLAGHTHGGQICWPDGSPLFRHDTLSASQTTGIHRINQTWMIINRGIGSAGLKMRLFCPPHAMQITLQPDSVPSTQ